MGGTSVAHRALMLAVCRLDHANVPYGTGSHMGAFVQIDEAA